MAEGIRLYTDEHVPKAIPAPIPVNSLLVKERWVKVGSAPDETRAMMMEGVLRSADIPVLIQRGAGFDAPEFLAAGPRNVMVPSDFFEAATEVLEDTTGIGSWFP